VTRAARCILAPNPGPLTLDGTNTWVLGAPAARDVLVVDPGPDDETHLLAVRAAVAEAGARVAAILLTHGHLDHSAGARRLGELTGAPVRALDPHWVLGGEGLRDGDVLHAGGLDVEVVAVPGHSSDSLAFVVDDSGEGEGAVPSVLTGDTVLGRGTSVVAWPDGRLGAYLESLRRLRVLAARRPLGLVMPGHGPVLDDAGRVLEGYERHREARLDQVRAALVAGASSAEDVVRVVYAEVDPALWPAARRSVEAQLEYLHTVE
jgi:glyoxylase-like metal-dependent hydrolase (beta-lactamase superfamily II)